MITIDVDDIGVAMKSVVDHGGTAVGELLPVADMGIAGYFKDSEGNLMGLWQTTTPTG